MYDTSIVTDNLTLDNILSRVDEYHIYSYYIGHTVKVNKPISSPFRKDDNPSWGLFRSRSGDLMWKDFATGDTGNVVMFVQNLFNVKYHKALERIWDDIIAKNGIKRKPIQREPVEKIKASLTVIEIQRKYFTQPDIDYWTKFKINRATLKKFEVTPIQHFWVNGIQNPLFYTGEQPMYAYKMFDKFKIYRPLSKTKADKWRTNCGFYDLQGFKQLPESGELLIITKSLKDVMVLHQFGYPSIAPQSENSSIPKKAMDELKKRFKRIVVFFDYDNGGIQGAEKLADKFELNKVFISKHYLDIYGIKDISDFVKEMGLTKTKKLIKELFHDK